jgi:hypothetical protein
MADPVTIGVLIASALAMAREAVLKGAVGEAAEDAYGTLRRRVAQWAGSDLELLEKTPALPARQAAVAKVVDGQSAEERATLGELALDLIASLKYSDNIDLDIGRLETIEVGLGIAVTEGVRSGNPKAHGTFRTGDISPRNKPIVLSEDYKPPKK